LLHFAKEFFKEKYFCLLIFVFKKTQKLVDHRQKWWKFT